MEATDLIGAITAVGIYALSITVFISRIAKAPRLERASGILMLFTVVPLVYLLAKASTLDREPLYYLQIAIMIMFLLATFLLDYLYKPDFRSQISAVIAYVVLFFAGTGGMLGVAAKAGSMWLTVSLVLFFIMAVLAFVQRKLTGK